MTANIANLKAALRNADKAAKAASRAGLHRTAQEAAREYLRIYEILSAAER